MNKVLEWLSLLDSALQQMAGQLWTFHIAQDMWGGSDKKEQVTLFDVFVEISNIYQIHHQHKFFPGEKAVGEITITMHPDIKDCLIISEVDCPWTGYYRGKTWCEFQFLIGAWRGVVLGFCGKESKLVVEESSPYLRRIVLSL
ncbi:MAG: hypothetical protein GY762_06740 [Proteobacteria bacterium]|nr:hypothetical protein [Pseudomonadota bacterium]